MSLTNIIHRKLSSVLQPWLQGEPELELKLGFINSLAILKNISLSAWALNQFLDEESSNSLCVKEVNVEYLSLRFSNWSTTAFTFEVRGVHVILSARETKEGSSRKDRKSGNLVSEDVKRRLSAIDPEGSALHDVLERILNTAPSRNRFTTSILNLVLSRCNLQMLSISLQLQLPIFDDSFVYIFKVEELNAESLYFQQGCLLRGLVGLLFRPLKEVSFDISGSGFEIGYTRNDHINHVCSLKELFTCIKLVGLQLVDFRLRIPELSFSFSPVDLTIFVYLSNLSPKVSKLARNGRLLWKLASRKVTHVISAPSLSLHNAVSLVSLWLRYVNAYEYLLFLLGYCADQLLKRSVVKMSQDKIFLASAKNNWEVISDIEKELPPEAIAQARRIARYRAALSVQHAEDGYRESFVSSYLKFFCKILPLLVFAWKIMYKLLYLIVGFLFSSWFSSREPDVHLGAVSKYSCQHYCSILNLEKVFISFCPEKSVNLVNQRVESQTGISSSDFLSFCLSVDRLIFVSIEDIFKKSLFISCGELKITSSTYVRAPIRKSSSKNFVASGKGHRKGVFSNVKSILWGEPAQLFLLSETNNKSSPHGHAEGRFNPALENFLGDMCLNWKRLCMKFEESEIEYSENPWLLCETKSFLTHPDLKNPDSGFWKCNMTMGKLNLDLGYSSMLSIALLLRQIEYAVCWNEGNERSKVLSGFPKAVADQHEIICNDKHEIFASGIKKALLRMLPEKHIQIGVLIAGPHIHMSSRKVLLNEGNKDWNHLVGLDDFHLEFDVHNIELVIWPTSKFDLASFTRFPGSNDAEQEYLKLQEPQMIDIPRSDDEKYSSQGWISLCAYLRVNGLNAYFGDSMKKQHNQIFALKPITVHLSSFREYVHSFTTSVIAFSTALHGMASGFTIISFIDELYVFFQVVVGSLFAISYDFNSFDSAIFVPFREFLRQDLVPLEHENEETAVNGPSLICTTTLISLKGTFRLKSMDIVFHNSRMHNKGGSKKLDASNSNKLDDDFLDYGLWISVHQTSIDMSCEEGKTEVLVDSSGIKSLMVRYEDHIAKSFDHLVLRDLLLQPHNCLHELSLSNCILTLWFGHPYDALSSDTMRDIIGSSNSVANLSHSMENSPLTSESEKSLVWSSQFVQKLGFTPNIFTPAPSQWILINIAFGEVLVTRCSAKNGLIGAHQVNKLLSSLSVGGEFQTVSWAIQGGHLFLEITALLMFIRCFSSYLDHIANLLSILQTSAEHTKSAEDVVDMTRSSKDFIEESAQGTHIMSRKAKCELLEVFTLNVTEFSVVLVIEDDSGGVRELVLDVDAHMNLGMTNSQKKFKVDISRLLILSQFLQEGAEDTIQIPHFSSITSNGFSSGSVTGEDTVIAQNDGGSNSFNGASCSKSSASKNEFGMNDCASKVFCLSHQNHILKHLAVYISIEKLENNLVGSGSVSGFDMTISLSELQMILSAILSFSEASSKEMTSETTERYWSNNQETDSSMEAIVPDGTIVAIQDVDQHTYFTVEGREKKYTLVGSIHYSLVGERALFRVKYHNQRRWKSSVLWFSLISLYAKNDSGEPLRLNYRSGSSFVDISSTDDSRWALWRTLSCESESYNGDIDLEPRNQLVKKTFYLVNRKNDCAVAFIDGVPEFVAKPGNPFKFKVFNHFSMTSDFSVSDRRSLDASGTNLCHSEHKDEGEISGKGGAHPCIDITIDKVALTIVHELLDTKDRFPLLYGCISDTQLAVQILSYKARVISTSRVLLSYFDAQRNFWRELVRPIEICIYYRASSQSEGSETFLRRVPLHIYCRTEVLI